MDESDWTVNSDCTSIQSASIYGGESSLTASFQVESIANVKFEYDRYWYGSLNVYIDNELSMSVSADDGGTKKEYSIIVGAGNHTIKWTFVKGQSEHEGYATLYNIGIAASDELVTASLLHPGSLGTEILAAPGVDRIQDVAYLKVIGAMNDADWSILSSMNGNLVYLDLSEATANEIPESQFSSIDSEWSNLKTLTLPQGITIIRSSAFIDCKALGEVTFPETLTTIEQYAFYGSSITTAILPESLNSLGDYVFEDCDRLIKVHLPYGLQNIPRSAFYGCSVLKECNMPDELVSVRDYAFYGCTSLDFSLENCTKLNHIGALCFNSTGIVNLKFPDHLTSENFTRSNSNFSYCQNLVSVEFPTGVHCLKQILFRDCPNLTNIIFKSPTVVFNNTGYGNAMIGAPTTATVKVPSFAVANYKLDEFWYQYNIEGFDATDVKDWYIHAPLTLDNDRIDGDPNIFLQWSGAALEINGSAAQTINDFYVDWCTLVLSNCDKVTIDGTYTHCYETEGLKWYYISLPFNFRVGDITTSNGAQYAIRYYDGASRATNGASGNWKNFQQDDVIAAGTGFILQTSKDCYTFFYAQDDDSKQNVFKNAEFIKTLVENASEQKADKGWNLVGNPWQTYYNIHKMNFTAPITCWNGSSYTAYSVIDDDYAIKPNEAFFVQCPEEINEISFPIDGRQLTSVIESQNAARPTAASQRMLIDVELTDGEQTDKTRFVLNPKAAMEYETSRDASKFMSMDNSVPQIYTVEQGVQMAINERPLGEGTVQLGFKVAKDGQYTISAPRNQFKNIVLADNATGQETDLATSDYTFSTEKGTDEQRFVLRVGGTTVTSIENVEAQPQQAEQVFNLQGQRVNAARKGLYIVNGKKVMK